MVRTGAKRALDEQVQVNHGVDVGGIVIVQEVTVSKIQANKNDFAKLFFYGSLYLSQNEQSEQWSDVVQIASTLEECLCESKDKYEIALLHWLLCSFCNFCSVLDEDFSETVEELKPEFDLDAMLKDIISTLQSTLELGPSQTMCPAFEILDSKLRFPSIRVMFDSITSLQKKQIMLKSQSICRFVLIRFIK